MEELKPIEIQLGNFIESMGNIEIVMGISQTLDGNFFIEHKGWNRNSTPIPDGILYSTYPILITDEWKQCENILCPQVRTNKRTRIFNRIFIR